MPLTCAYASGIQWGGFKIILALPRAQTVVWKSLIFPLMSSIISNSIHLGTQLLLGVWSLVCFFWCAEGFITFESAWYFLSKFDVCETVAAGTFISGLTIIGQLSTEDLKKVLARHCQIDNYHCAAQAIWNLRICSATSARVTKIFWPSEI